MVKTQHIITIAILFSLTSINVSAQQFEFDKTLLYKLTYAPDSSKQASLSEEYFELFINDSVSLFRSFKKGKLDSANQIAFQNGNTFGDISVATAYYTKFNFQIFKKDNSISYFDYMEGHYDALFRYDEMLELNWLVMPDTKNIQGMECQLASTNYAGRVWDAWFCKDIPIFEGPYKFSGLPGLIIKITSDDRTWDFELVNLNTNEIKRILFNQRPELQIKNLSKKDFYKETNYYKINKIQIDESMGLIMFPTANDRKMMQANYNNHLKSHSNNIEIHP
ncbi:MAG TPA: GLPGLI family protein [Bacillaceae bacterium]|nr:GLPGLI family protein [Bacillaceae bacterium]